jgi:YHS domain-containing protein
MKTQQITILLIVLLATTVGCQNQPQAETTNTPAPTTATTAKTSTNNSPKTPSAKPADNQVNFYTENGIAIKGTDPVAYFREGKAVKGSSQFTHKWKNATWQFSSQENRDLFAKTPEKYAPQFGGFCAWAVSENYTAPIDPEAWKIVNEKLYLNFNKSVQRSWERDETNRIARGDRNWPNVRAKLNK